MNGFLKCIYLLTKRLYKKITFLSILLLIPLIVLGLGIVAKQESGFISIALAQEDASDNISNEIINDLKKSSNLVLYTYYDTPDDAANAVKSGRADAAWIFPSKMQERIDTFASNSSEKNYIATVIEREENILLKLSHEKLSSVLFKHCAETKYINFVRDNLEEIDHVSNEKIMEYYYSFDNGSKLFEFALPDDNGVLPVNEVNYLTAPVRGLLGVIVMMCGLAAALFYMKDQKNGTFGFISSNKKPLIEALSYSIAVINVAVVALIAMALAGVTVTVFRELFVMLIYIALCVLFCMLIRRITSTIKILASVLPLLAVASIVICPVFIDFKSVKLLQFIFPTTYYINSVYNNVYILYSLIYAVCIVLIIAIFDAVKSKKILLWK